MVENQYNNNNNNNIDRDTWSLYLYALKSPVTRQKYQKKLEKFFDFLGIEGSRINIGR
ncbi:MAG: hypothetical protein ACTHKC_06610 [Candidatus Nitrosocosmicus sp.]